MRKKLAAQAKRVLIAGVLFFCGIVMMPETGKAAGSDAAYEQQKAPDLLQGGRFTVSGGKVVLTEDGKAGGVMLQGDASDYSGAVFSLGDAFAFGKKGPDYLVVDALAERKKNITLAFYLDNAKTPFATVALGKQKRKENWSTVKNRCVRLQQSDISGTHKLSFKVQTKEVGNLKLVFRSLFFMKIDIPVVELDLDESQGTIAEMNSDSEHATECYGDMTLRIPEGYRSEYTDKVCETQTYKLDYIRGRGNSTWMTPKKPYKLKLENKQDLLGMGANKHWILLANYYDVSMLRNKITYWLGEQLGMEFTPQCEFVNVIMNGEYLGSYYLCEQIRVGKSRVNIDDLEQDVQTEQATDEATISGGYLLSMSPYEDESQRVFGTEKGNRFWIESPSFEDYYNEIQAKYIRDYVQKTENAIYGEGFKDSSGTAYQDYMDIDAAIDYYWVQEVSQNGDGFGSNSTYLYKKRNGKLYWGPLWDFDFVAWGATEYSGNQCAGYTHNGTMWFRRLFLDPTFYKRAVERWSVIREKLLEACKDGGQIDKYSQKQYESQKYNYAVWKKYSDNMGWDFLDEGGDSVLAAVTYDDEIVRFKSWIKERVEWIDNNLDALKKEYKTVTFMVDDTEVARIQVEGEGEDFFEMPAEPVKEGYVFDGWYTTVKYDGEEYEYPFNAEYYITENITVKAKWSKETEVLPLEQIAFARDDVYMFQYDEAYLQNDISVLPFGAKTAELTWSSSNEEVANVDGTGLVTTKNQAGEAVITVTDASGTSASCTVHVIDHGVVPRAVSFRLESKEVNIRAGEYTKIKTEAVPKDSDYFREYQFASSDEDVVKVDNHGFVYGVKEGTALVAVTSYDFGTKFCRVTVGKNDGTTPTQTPIPTTAPTPTTAPIPTLVPTPEATSTAPATQTPSVSPSASPDVTVTPEPSVKPVKKGKVFSTHGIKYKVLSVGTDRRVSCIGIRNKKQKKLVIPGTVRFQGKVYSVTEIGDRAFAGCKRLVKAEIGIKVKRIGVRAFMNCKKLKKINILSSKLGNVGKGVVKGAPSRIKLTAPGKKKAKYMKMFGMS